MIIGVNISFPLSNRIGSRKANFLCLIIYVVSLSIIVINKNLMVFYILYSGFLSLSLGLMYMTPLTMCLKYFPKRKGLVTGIILSCFGISGVLVSTLMIYIINPDNINPTIDENK